MATQASGSNAKIIVATEGAFKTAAVTQYTVLPFISETFRLSRNLVESQVIRPARNPAMPARGNYEISGEVTTELNPTMGKIFKHALGSMTQSGAGPYTYTFKIGALPTSLSMEKQFTDLDTPQYFVYSGCKISSFSFTAKPEGPIESRFSFMGAKEAVATSTKDATPRDLGHNPFDGYECSITQGGSALGTVTQIEATIDNAVDGSNYVIDGTGERYSLPEGKVKVSGTITALFDDITLYNLAVAHTETSVNVIFTKGNGNGSAGNEKLTVIFNEVKFTPNAPVVDGPNGLKVEMPFIAYYDNHADASSMIMTLQSPLTWGSFE
jgi:hypothetical protein